MYRTTDPRFRRRLNDLSATLESANESAQSGLYIFTQRYIRPAFSACGSCLGTCVDAACPQRERLRRGRGGGGRGRAELNFDFYDDWEEEEEGGLLGWGEDEVGGYGTVAVEEQPARGRGMSYGRRKSVLDGGGGEGGGGGGGAGGLLGRLFGAGRAVRYQPSAADLQEHPGKGRSGETEGLLEGRSSRRQHGRTRSGTVESRETADSLSSRGDIFPSDEEDDAVPLDDEFAMVLERRNTQSGPETESSSGKTGSVAPKKRGKRPSGGSRVSSRRTVSSRSSLGRDGRSRNSSVVQTPVDEERPSGIEDVDPKEVEVPTMKELTQEERKLAEEEEAEIARKREEAKRVAAERGLAEAQREASDAVPMSQSTAKDADEHHENESDPSPKDDLENAQ